MTCSAHQQPRENKSQTRDRRDIERNIDKSTNTNFTPLMHSQVQNIWTTTQRSTALQSGEGEGEGGERRGALELPERGALPTASIVLTVTYNVGIQHVYTPSVRTHRERTSGRQMSALYVLTIPGKLQIHTDNARFEPGLSRAAPSRIQRISTII